jgi:N-acetylglucosamine transport system permease protein
MRRQRVSPIELVVFAVLLAYLVVTVFPMIWVAYTSLKTSSAIQYSPFTLPPLDDLQISNYTTAWVSAEFSRYFINSLLVSVVSLAATLMLGSMAGYALSRFRVPGGNFMFYVFLAGLMVPIQLALIPLFFQMREMNLLNTRLGLVFFYTATSLPFAIFVLSGFFKTLPASLHEAAQIDGCSEWRIFWSVMLPLARPGLITVAFFTFLGVWNEYFGAFMFMSGAGGEPYRTLPLGLANIMINAQYRTDYGVMFAGLVLTMVPVLLVYLVLQKYLVKGITAGAVKG